MPILARDPTPLRIAAVPSPRALHSRAYLSTMLTPVSARTYSASVLLTGSDTGSRDECRHAVSGGAIGLLVNHAGSDGRTVPARGSVRRVRRAGCGSCGGPGARWFLCA